MIPRDIADRIQTLEYKVERLEKDKERLGTQYRELAGRFDTLVSALLDIENGIVDPKSWARTALNLVGR